MLLPSTTASKCQIYNFTDSTSRRSPPLPPRKATQTSLKSHRSITNSLKSSAKRSRMNYQSTAPMTTLFPCRKALLRRSAPYTTSPQQNWNTSGNILMRTSVKISFATHSHQRRLLSSLSRNLMDHYVYVLIIVALTESQSRIATLSLLSASCLAAWAKQNTSPNSICEMDTIAFGSPEGKNGKQPSTVDMDFMNIKLCLLAFAMLLARFNTLSTTPSENILMILWLPISTTCLFTRTLSRSTSDTYVWFFNVFRTRAFISNSLNANSTFKRSPF